MVHELDFQVYSDRLPPQNIDAEEAILGGILLDPEAIARVAELLHPKAFYISAHQDIYRAALTLHAQGQPTDLMSMATWLRDQGMLDKLGGQQRLAQLVDCTISAANIDQYAQLIMDKYLRRQLIQVGNEISRLGYDTAAAIEKILDQAEQKVFGITQVRPNQSLASAADILTSTFSDIERRSLGLVLPGISCGFYDLDAMTQGFQRSDLIIAAGRPAMGKTSLCLSIARNIAAYHKLPVAIFSLEMSKEQLVYRLLSSEVQIETGRLRSGRISQTEWEPLGHAISNLSQLPIFIDDTPNASVLEMRSKVRRLQAENGGTMGLVLVDYLQLMESAGSDNRVQELSKVTRGLKGLARELNVPVIALSQLSRGVESRTNKRPMMSDLRECVTGDTQVALANGQQVPIQTLVGQTPEVLSMNSHGQLVRAQADLVWSVGRKPVYRIQLASGRTIQATANHRLYGVEGWQEVRDLRVGSRLAIARSGAVERIARSGAVERSAPQIPTAARVQGTALLAPTTLVTQPLVWDEVTAIQPWGAAEVYDLTVPGTASWLANGIVSHNSGSIEQDADLIMMLYRDEYYNPDTPDRGVAELIISKHRNGPVGTVRLLFEAQYTRFRNLANSSQFSS